MTLLSNHFLVMVGTSWRWLMHFTHLVEPVGVNLRGHSPTSYPIQA